MREGRQDRREIGGRWLWNVAADERRIGLNRCLGLWKASREELCELGVRSQHVLLKVLLTRAVANWSKMRTLFVHTDRTVVFPFCTSNVIRSVRSSHLLSSSEIARLCKQQKG